MKWKRMNLLCVLNARGQLTGIVLVCLWISLRALIVPTHACHVSKSCMSQRRLIWVIVSRPWSSGATKGIKRSDIPKTVEVRDSKQVAQQSSSVAWLTVVSCSRKVEKRRRKTSLLFPNVPLETLTLTPIPCCCCKSTKAEISARGKEESVGNT